MEGTSSITLDRTGRRERRRWGGGAGGSQRHPPGASRSRDPGNIRHGDLELGLSRQGSRLAESSSGSSCRIVRLQLTRFACLCFACLGFAADTRMFYPHVTRLFYPHVTRMCYPHVTRMLYLLSSLLSIVGSSCHHGVLKYCPNGRQRARVDYR
jgi:hypothetical protein